MWAAPEPVPPQVPATVPAPPRERLLAVWLKVPRFTDVPEAIERLLKLVNAEPPMFCVEPPLNKIVLEPGVNVPLFDQLPLILSVCAPDKVNGALLFMVTFPFIVRVAPSVQVFVPVFVIIRLL